MDDVSRRGDASRIDFFDDDWYAAVEANIRFDGNPHHLSLVLQIEPDARHTASKWVMVAAHTTLFEFGARDSTRIINPVNHEVNFTSLYRVFPDSAGLMNYTPRDFRPDHLSIILYAAQVGQLSYEGATRVAFHFLQLDGWVFVVTRRPDPPHEWAITSLLAVTPEQKAGYRSLLLFE